jgi:hypothetical protein
LGGATPIFFKKKSFFKLIFKYFQFLPNKLIYFPFS